MTAASSSSSGDAHVLLPASTLARSPSRVDGIDASIEQTHRFWGCELIEEAGVLLRLPQVVMVTAQTMLHRFYYRKSLRDFDAFRVAIGCLFLAAKVEEQPKRIKDVLSVFYALYRRRKWGKTKLRQQLLELESESYDLWRDWLIMVERQVLIDLGFSLYNIMEHPHKYILYYIKILDGSKQLAQRAWGFLNDSLRIDLCVRFRAEVIACAAIFIAARQLHVKLPDQPMWFELFNVDRASLVAVTEEILELYKRDKIVWLDALTKVDPFAIDDMPDVATVAASTPITLVGASDEPESQQQTPLPSSKNDPGATEEEYGKDAVRQERVREASGEKRVSRFSERPESSSSRPREREQTRGRRSRRSRSRSHERTSSRRNHERSRRSPSPSARQGRHRRRRSQGLGRSRSRSRSSRRR